MMKNIPSCLLIFALVLLFSCKGRVFLDIDYTAKYKYKNSCSAEITVKSYYIKGGGVKDSTFNIPVGGEHVLAYRTEGMYLSPFSWYNNVRTSDADSTIITKGDDRVVLRWKDQAGIYNAEKYRIVSEKDYTRVSEYVVTDNLFTAPPQR